MIDAHLYLVLLRWAYIYLALIHMSESKINLKFNVSVPLLKQKKFVFYALQFIYFFTSLAERDDNNGISTPSFKKSSFHFYSLTLSFNND